MSFTIDCASQRVLPHVNQRYDEPTPPYAASSETTQPPSPDIPDAVEDVAEEQWRLREIRNKSKPFYQFRSQAEREKERLEDQLFDEQRGRRPTLPFDEATDYEANAENNVRARWVEQGIWGEEWGPAWLQGIRPLGIAGMLVRSCDGPFYNKATSHRRPGGSRWGHEQGNTPSPSPPPSPPPPRIPNTSIFAYRPPPPPPAPKQPRPRYQIARILPDGSIEAKVPKPTVRDPEASRPLPQFLYQVAKEREWIKDETAYKTPGRAVDLDSLAYQSVKKNWVKDGVWSPKWDGEMPGPSWYHEEPESWGPVEPQHAAPTSAEPAQRPPDLTAEDSQQQTRRRQDASPPAALDQSHLPVPASASEASNHAASNASNEVPNDEADAPRAGSPLGRRTRNTLSQQAAASDDVPSRTQEPRQSPRHASTTRPDHQDGARPSNTQARRTRPKRRRSDDTAESEQPAPPLKRAKKSGGSKGRASTANDGSGERTNDPRESPPASAKMGVQGARAMGSESNGDSQKGGTRRSARIASRQAQAEAAAAVANMTPAAPATSRPRAAREGKKVVMAPKSGKNRRPRR